MATVYLGRDETLGRRVAIKILRGGTSYPESPAETEMAARFEREGRTAARLSHANIVQVYDAGKDELPASGSLPARSVSYIVMEYVPGGDLKRLVDSEGPLSGRRLARLGAAVAAGLAHAHERGVIHRDVKPQNVLIDEYGNPKLTDFGIARALDPDGSEPGAAHMTRTGHYLGTALYSAPEQLNGEGATPKSDVYGLGATLYHAATGGPPFTGNPVEVATQQMERDPKPPREAGAGISPEMEAVILACLARDPEDRPSAADVQSRLQRAGLDEAYAAGGLAGAGTATGAQAGTTNPAMRTFHGGRDRGLLIVGAVAVVFLLAMLLGGLALFGGGGESAPGESGGANGAAETTQSAAADGEGVREEPAPEETAEAEETTEPEDAGPVPPEDDAASLVFDYYVAAAEGRYDDAWASLSSRYQGELGSTEELAAQESDLNGVFFDQGLPEATLDGREARVSFTVDETRSGSTQTVSGVWVCVVEDGEWRLDRLEEGA
ncbi:Protein kinase domain [Rubrobacter radiotolerans]|nr:Protein kinase domain [Rubrobacter radiotolerans]